MTGTPARTDEDKRISRIRAAAVEFARVVSSANYERGNVSWTREIVIAQEKIDEAVMWASKP